MGFGSHNKKSVKNISTTEVTNNNTTNETNDASTLQGQLAAVRGNNNTVNALDGGAITGALSVVEKTVGQMLSAQSAGFKVLTDAYGGMAKQTMNSMEQTQTTAMDRITDATQGSKSTLFMMLIALVGVAYLVKGK